jgi:adenine-specific DNA methylase
MIERWFPCKEVSENSNTGWGSGNQEKNLFTWFAARPTAQAKAAVVCSLLPWPDDEDEQARLQDLVRHAMTGRYAEWEAVRTEVLASNPAGVSVLDPFSGRGMIPLEAARLGFSSAAVDYSPVATLASHLLADFPFRDWTAEPPLPFGSSERLVLGKGDRLLADTTAVFERVGELHGQAMAAFYPEHGDSLPWGYLWAIGIPCQECGLRFPLVGSYELIRPRGGHQAQSFFVEASDGPQGFRAVVHAGPPRLPPTLTNAVDASGRKVPGKSAVCIFCGHAHPLDVHRRLVNDGLGRDELLLAADISADSAKTFRVPTQAEREAAVAATAALHDELPFSPITPATPNEVIAPGNNNIIGPSIYGARTYGDFMTDRQTLSYVRLARVIAEMGDELREAGLSDDYVRALTGYATAVLVKKLRRSTRGARFQTSGGSRVGDLFVNEGSITFSHDFFEAGIGGGPGTWASISQNVTSVLRNLLADTRGTASQVIRGTATGLPYANGSFSAVVTDPPYDEMIAYADASDLFYAWIKRSLSRSWPELAVTSESGGSQEKELEIIVKRSRGLAKSDTKDHRTRDHYDRLLSQSFEEMRRVVADDGVVTIVFGHGDPDVWQRLLHAITNSGLVLTASWPANTEAGGQQGKANIETTLTMACRPASERRESGRRGTVESAIKTEVKARYPDWERWGLAPTDMLMASAGPAMEIVGQYTEVLDAKGDPVDIATFLPLARAAVQEAMAVEVDHHPLETFDARTRFALWWVRLFGREIAPKSELRWQTLAASLELADVRDLVPDADKGCQFVTSGAFNASINSDSAVIDVALALAAVSDQGRDAMGQVLASSGRDSQDAYLWAAVKFLADRLPDSDPDSIAYNRVIRAKDGIASAADAIEVAVITSERTQERRDQQVKLF